MSGLFRKNPETSEGKYPIVLRRDGSVVTDPYFVIVLKDPCASAALRAYASTASKLGYDKQYVDDIMEMAEQSSELATLNPGNPDAAPDRVDDPRVLVWARSAHKARFGQD